jgi:hypothetical protein
MRMPAGMSFATFDPNQVDGGRGVTVSFTHHYKEGSHWGAIMNGTYTGPGTFGWQRRGSTWTFYGNPAEIYHGGITKLVISDRGSVEPGRIKVTVTARNARPTTHILASALPLQAFVVLGRFGEAAIRGECGETNFYSDQCRLNTSGTSVACK